MLYWLQSQSCQDTSVWRKVVNSISSGLLLVIVTRKYHEHGRQRQAMGAARLPLRQGRIASPSDDGR